MSLKIKIIGLITLLAVLFSFLIVGVVAAFQTEVSLSGDFEYNVPAKSYETNYSYLTLAYVDEANNTLKVTGLNDGYPSEVVIPSQIIYNSKECTITTIESMALMSKTNMTSLVIGSNVTSLSYTSFIMSSNIESIKIAKDNPVYEDRGLNAIIEKSTNKVVLGCKNTILDNTIKIIGESAFYGCSGLKSIVIPDSVEKIGETAFANCSNLKTVDVGTGLKTLLSTAFASSIKTLTFKSETPPSVNSPLTSLSSVCIRVPKGTKTLYANKTGLQESNFDEI